MTKADLARELDVSKTALTDLITHGKPSTLVEEVERVLDLDRPYKPRVSAIHFDAVAPDKPIQPEERNFVVMLRLMLELSPDNQLKVIERAETLLDLQRRTEEARGALADSISHEQMMRQMDPKERAEIEERTRAAREARAARTDADVAAPRLRPRTDQERATAFVELKEKRRKNLKG